MTFKCKVHTDDGTIALDLGPGDSIFDLIARGANGQEVTVYLGYDEARDLFDTAGQVRLLLDSDPAVATTFGVHTMGGVDAVGQPEGTIKFLVVNAAGIYRLDVEDGAGGVTALTVGSAAHDSLIVSLSTMLIQL